jgi:hypothetical protein
LGSAGVRPPGSLDFTVIDLPWLRTAANLRVAEDLPRRRGNDARNIRQYTLSSLVELATTLRLQRDDHRLNPPLLGRPDIAAFTSGLAFLQHSGALSPNCRVDILRHIRTVLASARSQPDRPARRWPGCGRTSASNLPTSVSFYIARGTGPAPGLAPHARALLMSRRAPLTCPGCRSCLGVLRQQSPGAVPPAHAAVSRV